MTTSTVKSDRYEKSQEEHEELREQLSRIHEVFQGMVQAPREISAVLDDFEETLLNDFEHEEMDGPFQRTIQRAPSLAGDVNRLRMEHHLLRSHVADLCQFAASGIPTMSWWRELASRCHVLSQKLLQHESAEDDLQHKSGVKTRG